MKRRKIDNSKSKDGFRYPILRLPREFEWLIGKEVEIDFKVVDGRKALVIYVDGDKSAQVVQNVVQLNDNPLNVEARLEELEQRLQFLE